MAKLIDDLGTEVGDRSLDYLRSILLKGLAGPTYSRIRVGQPVIEAIQNAPNFDGIYIYLAKVPEEDSDYHVLITGFDLENKQLSIASVARVHIASCPSSACPFK